MKLAAATGLLVVLGSVAAARADRPIAYVDEVTVYGGPTPAEADAVISSALDGAGIASRFAERGAPPCGDDGECLAGRARERGATIAVRVTIVEIAGTVVATLTLARPDRPTPRRHVEEAKELEDLTPALTAVFAEAAPAPATSPSRLPAWASAIGAVALGAAGGLATWRAYALRDRFFDAHVDPSGDVYGISPEAAEAEEARARRWQLAGALLLGGAAVAGVTATILFTRGDGGDERPAGLAIAGRF